MSKDQYAYVIWILHASTELKVKNHFTIKFLYYLHYDASVYLTAVLKMDPDRFKQTSSFLYIMIKVTEGFKH